VDAASSTGPEASGEIPVREQDFVTWLVQFPAFKGKSKSLSRKSWDELYVIVQKAEADSGIAFALPGAPSETPVALVAPAAPIVRTEPPVA
jgi:hypothetical protein